MLVLTIPTGQFATNVHILAEAPGQPCLIIDPGHEAAPRIDEAVRRYRLLPEAVLITHGHMDHTWDAVPVARRYGVPVHLHPADRYQLGAPAQGMPATFPQDLLAGHPNREPSQVVDLPEHGASLPFAAGVVKVLHTPGHTAGSVMFHLEGDRPLLATGDTLLASGPGHSLAPGGSGTALAESIRAIRADCPAQSLLLPGHGPRTTLWLT
jgi:glyoxylase-like metal-dependent hydrolase (beta-lactamase superfamily II)